MNESYQRKVEINRDVVLIQARLAYEMAMSYNEADDELNYRYFMGIAAMLYHLHEGYYELHCNDNYGNLGVY